MFKTIALRVHCKMICFNMQHVKICIDTACKGAAVDAKLFAHISIENPVNFPAVTSKKQKTQNKHMS